MRQLVLLHAAILVAALACAVSTRGATPQNVSVLGQIPHSGNSWQWSVFVHDNLVFHSEEEGVFPPTNRVYVHDVSDPAVPQLLSSIDLPSGRPRDMRCLYYSNGILYVGLDGTGVAIYDLSVPQAPISLPFLSIPGGVHNLRVAGQRLYAAGFDGGEDLHIYDVSNPAAPVYLGGWTSPGPVPGEAHDLSVIEDTAYVADWDAGLFILDIADPANIKTVGSVAAGTLTHSAWPTTDFTRVLTTHEGTELGLKVWDVRALPYAQTAAYQSHERPGETMIHDATVVGKWAYVTYYSEGLRILDLANPDAPVEVGSYFTGPGGCNVGPGLFKYCDSVSEWIEDGIVYVTDYNNGIWILSFDPPHDAPLLLKAVKSANAKDVSMSWDYNGEIQVTVRRSTLKGVVAGATMKDVDGRLETSDAVVGDGQTYYYTLNGPWR